jgi:hypothetical protein
MRFGLLLRQTTNHGDVGLLLKYMCLPYKVQEYQCSIQYFGVISWALSSGINDQVQPNYFHVRRSETRRMPTMDVRLFLNLQRTGNAIMESSLDSLAGELDHSHPS